MSDELEIPLESHAFQFTNWNEATVEILVRVVALQAESRALRDILLNNSALLQERSRDEVEAEYKLSLIKHSEKIFKDLSTNYPPASSGSNQ